MANCQRSPVWRDKLHKSLRDRFPVDDAVFQAQAFVAERKDCGCRSCSFGAQYAMARKRRSVAIDPVETGYAGAKDAARDPAGIPAGEVCEQGGS